MTMCKTEEARKAFLSTVGSLKGMPKQVSKDELWRVFISELRRKAD